MEYHSIRDRRVVSWRRLRWSRSFGPFEGFAKVYPGCETTPSSPVWI